MAVHLKLVYSRSATGAEDVAITTHDFEGPDIDTAAEQLAFFTPINDWWLGIDEHYNPGIRLLEGRVYNGYNGDGSPGQVDFVWTFNLPGLNSADMLPPQCAVSITEELYESHLRRHWGRFYLPNPTELAVGPDGRYLASFITDVVDTTQTWYNAAHAAGWTPIVWVSAAGGGQAIVDGLRVDDIVDIQRRRRWEQFVTRLRRDLATTAEAP